MPSRRVGEQGAHNSSRRLPLQARSGGGDSGQLGGLDSSRGRDSSGEQLCTALDVLNSAHESASGAAGSAAGGQHNSRHPQARQQRQPARPASLGGTAAGAGAGAAAQAPRHCCIRAVQRIIAAAAAAV